jgi:AcrR family transcriptional regulator
VVTRAGVTDEDFRTVFPTFEECYRATYERGLARLSRTVTTAAEVRDGWLEQIRTGLVALLGYLDDHPSWAHLLVLEAPVSVDVAFGCRQRLHGVLGQLLDDGQRARIAAGSETSPLALTADLVIGGVFSVIRTSMLERDGGKLVELAPSLVAFIVASYLGPVAARSELEGQPASETAGHRSDLPHVQSEAPEEQSSRSPRTRPQAISLASTLPIRATHRTTMVMRVIAQAPYSNNREIAQAAGIADEGQASKLLARLERQGVIENVGIGAARGEPNAWLLTRSGRRAAELLGLDSQAQTTGIRSRGVT